MKRKIAFILTLCMLAGLTACGNKTQKTDGMSEVIFHTEAVPRVNMMIQKLKFGRIPW